MAETENKTAPERADGEGAPRRQNRGRRGGRDRRGKARGAEQAVKQQQAASGEKRQKGEKKQGGQQKRPREIPTKQQKPRVRTLSEAARRRAELLSAKQKAFNEATDIMLSAAEPVVPEPVKEDPDAPKMEIVGVRFRPTGKVYYFSPGDEQFAQDEGVIVETARGKEYGFVALTNRLIDEQDTVHPLKTVVRRATEADTERYLQNRKLEEKARSVWDELVEKHKLDMSLTDIEYTFDNTKLIFYFTAEGRVDFRELVKDLAAVFRTRIELRQIGVRDEAKLIGGLGVCGMPFCCSRFLPDFVQVSIKMAKEQNLSLSSSKISGNCGRLMCCLRYEQDVYEREYETFPRANMVVQTAQGRGVITESNFLSGKIKVQLDGEDGVSRVFTREEVKVIGRARAKEPEPADEELEALEDAD